MKKINALIFEDDSISSHLLKSEVSKHFKDIKINGIARNLKEGIELYNHYKPNILFLDIFLGNESIFSFLDNLDINEVNDLNIQIIFITSSKDNAFEAIKYNPTGFILKPLCLENIKKPINKAINKLHSFNQIDLSHKGITKKIIAIPYVDKIELIKSEEIIFCEANGRYTKFHLINGDTKMASRNLGEYEKSLDGNLFFRIHHSYLVNILMIHHINKTDGNYCHLINHKTLPIAKRRQERLYKFLNLK